MYNIELTEFCGRRACEVRRWKLAAAWLRIAMMTGCCVILWGTGTFGATTLKRYYAHPAVEDHHGVIAPWYTEQNGQCDWRVRIAAETLKRYPWYDKPEAITPAPAYMFSGTWKITPEGRITPLPETDWANGDLGQRAAVALEGWVNYYRYSGDAAAVAHMTVLGDLLCDHCQTGSDHPWPNFLVSVPTKGKRLGKCDPGGMIQLDIVAEVGRALVQAAQVTGNRRWLDTAEHWAELLAEKRNRDPQLPPWNRYANPEVVRWNDHQTGGVVFLLRFFDELIQIGRTGKDGCIVEARDAGRAYLRDVLLPRWTVYDAWGRQYWDWRHYVQGVNVTLYAAQYLMNNQGAFPNWRTDSRNIITLFLNRSSVNPLSNSDVFSGAWAYPEDSNCCRRSLWYSPLLLNTGFAQYGVVADSAWGREMARRQIILATYDAHESGVVEDNIDGGPHVTSTWFKIAHPFPLLSVLDTMAWLPEVLGANRENHIMRSSSVVTSVVYAKGKVAYSTFDAPRGGIDVVRLAFTPSSVTADGKPLSRRQDLKADGFCVKSLPGGDSIVPIRRDGATKIVIQGDDPQEAFDDDKLGYGGDWRRSKGSKAFGGGVHLSSAAGATMTYSFTGNQVRLIGRVDPGGGLADVYLDDAKQLVGIDCWNPSERNQQVLYYKNGLATGKHTLKIVVRGAKNPVSEGANVYIDAVQSSAAAGNSGFGEGGGPTRAQRMIFGRAQRTDYTDSAGNKWRPGMEFVVRAGQWIDSVAASWWTRRRRLVITGTPDPELYRYGVHAPEFWVNVTVGPGEYDVRLKFAETKYPGRQKPRRKCVMNVHINGREKVKAMDVIAKAGGLNRALDLVFKNIHPQNGIIEIRFTGVNDAEAMVQAIEVIENSYTRSD